MIFPGSIALSLLLNDYIRCFFFILRYLQSFFRPLQTYSLYMGVVHPIILWVVYHTSWVASITVLLKMVVSRLSLILFNFFLSLELLRCSSYTIVITMVIGILNLTVASPSLLKRTFVTCLLTQSHPFLIQFSDPRISHYSHPYLYLLNKLYYL